MGLPDVTSYYRAMALVRILNWNHDHSTKTWVKLEQTMAGRNLAGAPWIPKTERGLSKWMSPLTNNTLRIWDKINQSGDYAPGISPLAPLEGFPWFPPGEEVGSMKAWGRDTTCSKFAPGGTLTPLPELRRSLGTVPMVEWRYHQLGCFFQKWKTRIRPLNSLTTFETRCVKIGRANHLLSQMYRLILGTRRKTTSYYIRDWEGELNHRFTTQQIKKLIDSAHHTSVSSQIQEMSYKFLSRWYRTPVRLAQMYRLADNGCWRGCGQEGTLLHLWWSCPKIRGFWQEIAPWVGRLSPEEIELTPLNFLFHGSARSMGSYKESITPHLLNAAKLLIPRLWKQDKRPTILEWKREVNLIMEAERWISGVKDRKEKFRVIWSEWEKRSLEIE